MFSSAVNQPHTNAAGSRNLRMMVWEAKATTIMTMKGMRMEEMAINQ